MTEPFTDPFTMDVALCDGEGIVRGGAMHHGTDYACTGSAHFAGEHIRCVSPAHDMPAPSMLEEILQWQRRLAETKRVVVCAPGREDQLRQLLNVDIIGLNVDIQSSPYVQGNEVYVIGRLDGF